MSFDARALVTALVAPVALVLGLGGCAELPVIDAGVCGNGVVEEGEHCDPAEGASGVACREPGQPSPCRYDCSVPPGGEPRPCPGGFACGTDGVCRAPSGAFARVPGVLGDLTLGVQMADFDADGREDILASGATTLAVHYFDGPGEPGKSLTVPSPPVVPTTTRLTSKPTRDIVLSVSGGIAVMLGSDDRTISPTTYATFPIPVSDPRDVRYIPLDVLPAPGDEVLVLLHDDLAYPEDTTRGDLLLLLKMPKPATSLVGGRIPAGPLDEDPVASPCDEVVLPFAGEDHVLVYSPCKLEAGVVGWNVGGVASPVKLPKGFAVAPPMKGNDASAGAHLADVNADGHLDLLVAARSPEDDPWIVVAYGLGDGRFHSIAKELPTDAPDGRAAKLFPVGPLDVSLSGDKSEACANNVPSGFPLAYGDLNGDGYADAIDAYSLYLSVPAPPGSSPPVEYERVGCDTSRPLTTALIADFNANGIPDAIAGSSQLPGIIFLNGAGGGAFNASFIATQRPVGWFSAGDFDGDLVLDLAFSEGGSPFGLGTSAAPDVLAVLFGRPAGAPDPLQRLGELGRILEIGSARVVGGDAVDDVGAIFDDGEVANLALLSGSTNRLLQSPFGLVLFRGTGPDATRIDYQPLQIAAGRFGGSANEDLAIVARDVKVPAGPGAPADAYRLWLIATSGDAKLESKVEDEAPAGDLDLAVAGVVAVDLDAAEPAEAVDELVLTAGSKLAIARVSGGALAIGEVVEVDDFSFRRPPEPGEPHSFRPTAGDLDGDGDADIVTFSALGDIVILWNEGTGTIDPSVRTILKNPTPSAYGEGEAPSDGSIAEGLGEGYVLSAFALVDADARPGKELLVLAYDASLDEQAPGAGGVYVVRVDGKERRVLDATRIGDGSLARSVAAGDVDGDGIDDVAVGEFGGVYLLRGVPAP